MSNLTNKVSTWSVYLLSNGSRTYIGSTTDPARRLRQHNGEIVGGARSTQGHKWELVLVVSGFTSRSEACRWERICKCRARGLRRRYNAMYELVFQWCPYGRKHYTVPAGLMAINHGTVTWGGSSDEV